MSVAYGLLNWKYQTERKETHKSDNWTAFYWHTQQHVIRWLYYCEADYNERKAKGPRTEPWGPPEFTSENINAVLKDSDRKDFHHVRGPRW